MCSAAERGAAPAARFPGQADRRAGQGWLIRNIRRDAKRDIEKFEEDGEISEDQSFKAIEDLQELTKESEGKADAVVERKSEEIMKF